MIDYENIQGCINGNVTKLADQTEKLREYMVGKTDEQKRLARSHLKTVKALKAKGK